MKKLKIIQIITRLDKGGSSRILLDIAKTLDKEKFCVKIISGLTRDAQEDLDKFSLETGVEIIFINSLRRDINIFLDIAALLKIKRILKKENPDIVHLHTSKAGFLGRIAAKLAAVQTVIYMPHGHIFYGYTNFVLTKIYIVLERFSARLCDAIITLSDVESRDFLTRKIGSKDKFFTIHNGIDLKDYQVIDTDRIRELKNEVDVKAPTPVVTVISRLEPVKGVEIFIRALAEVTRVIPNFTALIVGSGTLRESLQLKAKSLNLDEKIKFLGYRADIKEIISLSDIVVNPALNEGLGLVILEAQALGKVVIATEVGGVPEVIIDNQTGILVQAGDYKSLAAAIVRILQDKELAARLAIEAKKRIELEFSKEKMISRLVELYFKFSKAALEEGLEK